jgi:hypothetical protein
MKNVGSWKKLEGESVSLLVVIVVTLPHARFEVQESAEPAEFRAPVESSTNQRIP